MIINEIKARLMNHGYKLTSQRRAVLNVMLAKPSYHMSSEEIYDLVRKQLPDVGVATVYRTLQLLCRLNIVTKIYLDDNVSRYEINLNENVHNHHHLMCERCGKVTEVHEDLLEELERHIEADYGFKISNHQLGFYGKCKDCAVKEEVK